MTDCEKELETLRKKVKLMTETLESISTYEGWRPTVWDEKVTSFYVVRKAKYCLEQCKNV